MPQTREEAMEFDNWYQDIGRRKFLTALGGITVGTGAAIASGADETITGVAAQESPPDPGTRITEARRLGPRDVSQSNYKALWSYRKRQAVESLLLDPMVNSLAGNWITSFEAYDPLTNGLDAVSIQGTTDMTVEGSRESGSFNVTAVGRQVAYGLIDRTTEELVGLEVTEPMDIEWQREFGTEKRRRRHEFVLDKDRVWQHLEGRDWYPLVKVAEIITAFEDFPHGKVTPVAYFFKNDDGGLSLLSTFLNVFGDLELLTVNRVDDFVRKSPMEMAREMDPTGESQLGDLPVPPMAQRPQITGPKGFHNITTPPDPIRDANWNVDWSPPVTEGAVVDANYNGSNVFKDMAAVATPTGYDLPERNGRNTREWYFPDERPVFSGDLLYWDIHSASFGGPGVLGKTVHPKTGRHPRGFRLRTHYHTGALPNARDFHSGHRFGPYNYYINFDFYDDGVFMPSWQRHGPGYITEYLNKPERRENDGPVQYYLSYWAFRPTPGDSGSTITKVFDGDKWTKPETETYIEGDEEKIVRFTHSSFTHTIDIPLDDQKEMVVVRPDDDEIGKATRVLDSQAELNFYHPAQYISGDDIQDKDVMAWLILEAPIHQVPHPSGISTFTSMAEFNLSGYD